MPLMEIADATPHYDEYGTGDEVVLSSAMAFDPQAYPGCLAAPPTGHHVYTIQARGHGASSHPDSPPEQGWLDQWAGISVVGTPGHFIGTESPERLVREVRVFVDELNGIAEPLTATETGARA